MQQSKNDILGAVSAIACSIHCIALPLVVLWLGAEAHGQFHLVFDLLFLGLGVFFAFKTLIPTMVQTKNPVLITLVFLGLLLFIVSFLIHDYKHILFAVGGLLWASAHIYNHQTGHKHSLS